MCVRERRCTVLHEESEKLRTDPFRGEASNASITPRSLTRSPSHDTPSSSTRTHLKIIHSPPQFALLQPDSVPGPSPHHDCASQTHGKSHHTCITHRSRFTFAQPLASTRLHHSATAGSTASSAPGHILIRTIDVSTLHIAGRASLPQAAPRTQSSSTALLWRSLVPIIYWAFTSLRALALPRTPCPFASLPDGILDSDGALPMAPGLAMPEGCFSIAGASFLTAASASV